MRQCVLCLAVCGVLSGFATSATAQTGPWADRGYVNIGFGVESGSSSLADTQNLVIYEEAGTISSTTNWTSGSLIDAAFGVRVWRNLTVGIAYHQEENDTDAAITGSIPSPIFFNRPRTLEQDIVLDRKEKAAHLVLGWVLPFNDKFDLMVFGGGLVKFWEDFSHTIDESLPVVPAQLANNAGIIGAALMARQSQIRRSGLSPA